MRKKIGKYRVFATNTKNKEMVDSGDVWLTTHQNGMVMSLTVSMVYPYRTYTDETRFSIGNLLKKIQNEFGNTVMKKGCYYSQYYINIRFLSDDIGRMNRIFEKTFTIYPRGYNQIKDEFIKYRFNIKLHTSIKDAYNTALLDRL